MAQHPTFTMDFGGKPLTVQIGKFARAANGSCTVQYGNTVVLATAVMNKEARPGMGYFPLMVDFEEKLYAAGRIKGSRFIKREGRPTDEAVLVARFIDRAIRPLFDSRIENDVQVILSVLAFDSENDADIPALIGASLALHISDIPWNGPIASARVNDVDGTLILNGTYEQREAAMFDIDVAGTPEKLIMMEAGAKEARKPTYSPRFNSARKRSAPSLRSSKKSVPRLANQNSICSHLKRKRQRLPSCIAMTFLHKQSSS